MLSLNSVCVCVCVDYMTCKHLGILNRQQWKVTKYIYSSTEPKCKFEGVVSAFFKK